MTTLGASGLTGAQGVARRVGGRWSERVTGGWWQRRPDRVLVGVAALGWVVLAGHTLTAVWAGPAEHVGHAGHAGHTGAAPGSVDLAMVATMTIAMTAGMAVLIAPNARAAAMRSPRERRFGAVADVTMGWAGVWLLALAATGVVIDAVVDRAGRPAVIAVTVVAAASWQLAERRRRYLVGCHRLVLPPLDVRAARRKCRRYGVRLGWDCWRSCGVMMAAMVAAGHSLIVAVPLVAVSWWERARVAHHERRAATGAAIIAAAGTAALLLAVAT